MPDLILRFLLLALGLLIIYRVMVSTIRTFVLARAARDSLTALIFQTSRALFDLNNRRAITYAQRDRNLAFYAPFTLIMLPIIQLILLWIAYTLIFIALGAESLFKAMLVSGSSLLTLGYAHQDRMLLTLIEFSEATLGLIVIALLIAYLPTMYNAFSNRERLVTLLEVRAGNPPSAAEMLLRSHRIRGLDSLTGEWETWERWFAELEESHTSLPALVFFRSIRPDRSWLTSAGAILDAAAIHASTLDLPNNPQAQLCIRAGYLALRFIAEFFQISYNPHPRFPDEPISISQQEFDELYDQLKTAGLPVKEDRQQCWLDYAGWRVNYDRVLLRLCALTAAPYAPWSSDRSLPH
jgi:hypothetical protein